MTLRTAAASIVLSVLMPGIAGYVACIAASSDLIGATFLAAASAICFACAGARSVLNNVEYVGNDDEESYS